MSSILRLLKLSSLFLVGMFIVSCGGDDEKEAASSSCTDELSFELNGESWTAVSFNNTLLKANDPASGLDAKRMDIRATDASGNTLIITLNNVGTLEGDCMDTGFYVDIENATTTSNTVLYTYFGPDGTQFAATIGTLNISECNESAKSISGTFTFFDEFNENAGANGSFNGVCYR